MKKWNGWKKILFIVILTIVVLRIAYIVIGGEVDKRYYTSAEINASARTEVTCINVSQIFKSEQNRLNSLEFIFTGIANDKQGGIILEILKDEELVYQARLSLNKIDNNVWKKVYVNLPLEKEAEYVITMNASEDCTQIPNVLITEGAPEAVAYTIDNIIQSDGQVAIKYGYLQEPTIGDKIVSSSIWIVFLVVVSIFLNYAETIKMQGKRICSFFCEMMGKDAFFVIAEIVLCMVILNCSGITFQEPTKIILYVLSIISAYRFKERHDSVMRMLGKPWKKGMLYGLYAYSAFALVGQRILIYPLTLKVTAAGLFVFGVTYVWFIPIVISTICGFTYLSRSVFIKTAEAKKDNLRFSIIIILLLLVPAAYNLYANNPGISSNDTYNSMLVNAHNLRGMYDWHPAFYCMVLRVILGLWDTTYAVILVQYFFWAYVMLEMLRYLREKGVKDGVILGVALFSGTNAANFLHLNTIWKDIPYALSLMWAFVIIAKLVLDYENYKGKWYIYLELIVALIGMFFYRKNGVVPFAMIVVMMAIVLRKNIKVWCSFLIAFLLIIIIKFPVYSYFEVEDPGRYGMYIGLSQDILGVYYAGGEVSERTLQMINVMTDYNNAEYNYKPTWSYQSYNLDVEPIEFVLSYIDTFLKNPVTMIRAIVDREDAIWDIFLGQDSILGCVNYHITFDGMKNWNDYYPERKHVSLYTDMSALTNYTANSQWISAIQWRCGLFTLLGIIVAFTVVIRRRAKRYILMLTPIIGQIISLLISTGWSDFRYFWPLNLMNMCLILFSLVILREEEE